MHHGAVAAASDLPTPRARRLAAPRWRDTRLVGGVLLLLLSVALGAQLVGQARQTVPVLAAVRDLSPGAPLRPGDVTVSRVHLGGRADGYLSGGAPVPAGLVVTRPVAAGELVPRGAVAPRGSTGPRRVVTVPVERYHYPQGLAAGERVDVYVTPRAAPGATPAPPELVVAATTVAGVEGAERGFVGAGTGVGVALSVAPDQVARLVGAVQRGAVDLVRVPADEP